MKRLSLIAAALSLPLALWMGALALPTLAEDGEDTDTEESEEQVAAELECASSVATVGEVKMTEYAAFLDAYFQSADDAASDQVLVAMEYYRYVEDSMYDVYNQYAGFDAFESGDDIDDLRASQSFCGDVLNQYMEVNRTLLNTFALKSGGGKKAVETLDAMLILNQHLVELEVNFLETFPGSFNQMNNALPCFAKACIGS